VNTSDQNSTSTLKSSFHHQSFLNNHNDDNESKNVTFNFENNNTQYDRISKVLTNINKHQKYDNDNTNNNNNNNNNIEEKNNGSNNNNKNNYNNNEKININSIIKK
jgi:hypothetical protein